MKPKVLFAVAREFREQIFPAYTLDVVRAGCDIIDVPAPQEPDAAFLRAHLGAADVVVSGWGTDPLTAEVLAAAPSLKLLAHAAGTIKGQMTPAAWDRGIRVTGAAPAIAQGVAEFCLGLIITATKRVYWFADRIRQGSWSRSDDVFGKAFEIYRQKVGVIGASHVGRRLVELLKPFGCTVMVFDPYWSAEKLAALGAQKAASLEDLFSQCRVVSLNAPVTKETEGMIRGKHFALLPEGAVFINTARAVLVNQEEMLEQLNRGRFVACLDVTLPEPPPLDHPLRRLPNVILTPHEAGAMAENLARIGEFISSEIARFASGSPLAGEVTRVQLDTIA